MSFKLRMGQSRTELPGTGRINLDTGGLSMPNHKSPAVESVKQERAEQRKKTAKGSLDKGLEDSFPASDPISTISTGIPSGRADAEEAHRVKKGTNPSAKQ
jgi:hypothetical protein